MDDAADRLRRAGASCPCVIQDWRTGEVLTLAYMNAEALAATRATGELHLWSRWRDELWHKGATSGNTQAVQRDPLRLRRRRAARARRARRPGVPHRRAHVLPPRRARAAGAARGAARRWSARSPRAPRAPEGSYTARLLADPALDGREGAGGGRGGRPRRARGDRRARRRGGRRRALPPRRAAAPPRARARRRRGGAACPSPLSPSCGWASARRSTRCASSPREHNLVPVTPDVHRGLRDAGLRVPEAARRRPRVPARVGRAGPARRALVVHRLPAAPRCVRWIARRRRRPVRARGRRGRAPPPGAAARPAAVRRRRGRLLRLRLRAHRRAARRRRTRTRSACPTSR